MPGRTEGVRTTTTTTPRVSICLPNLNTRPFLPERFETIRAQSFQNWELLVYDSYSDDGAWEYICEQAASDPKIRAWQGPREGVYRGWNTCIRAAQGEYVYIATSDDTMPPDCLEKLVAAMDAHPECSLAHCPLKVIDEQGRDAVDWWPRTSVFAKSSGSLIRSLHVRKAPFDGVLHLLGETVYISITQLLIRRSLFDRIGMFDQSWGSMSDFNWHMKAGLVSDTIHVPDTWGGWRVHPQQATSALGIGSPDHAARIDDMIEKAFDACETWLALPVRERLKDGWVQEAREYRTFLREMTTRRGAAARRLYVAGQLLAGSSAAQRHVQSLPAGLASWRESFPAEVRAWLEATGTGPILSPVSLSGSNVSAEAHPAPADAAVSA